MQTSQLDLLDGPLLLSEITFMTHRVQSILSTLNVLQMLRSVVPAQQVCFKPIGLTLL